MPFVGREVKNVNLFIIINKLRNRPDQRLQLFKENIKQNKRIIKTTDKFRIGSVKVRTNNQSHDLVQLSRDNNGVEVRHVNFFTAERRYNCDSSLSCPAVTEN